MKPRAICLTGFVAAFLCASGATAIAQEKTEPPDSPTATAPQTPTAQLPATVSTPDKAPSSDPAPGNSSPPVPGPAPGSPPPDRRYPPPGFPPPPGYCLYPPPGYPPAPGYYPPPGYYPLAPGFYPQSAYGPSPGRHKHDGFYMRLTMGPGYLKAKDSFQDRSESVHGGGLTMSFAFGGALTPSLILYGELVGTMASEPTLDSDGTSQTMFNTDESLFGIGPGVAYYLESLNVYFSGTLAFSQVTKNIHDPGLSTHNIEVTNMGIGLSLMAGKEWWVSDDWAIGVAGLLHVASMQVKAYDARMNATAASVVFSATYN